MIATLDDFDCVYEVHGDGPAVTFLHSVGLSTREVWKYQIPQFSKTFKTLSFDFRGLGESSKGTKPLTVNQYVNDIELLLERQGIRQTVIMGASLGGFVAQAFALKRPDLVSALVLVSTTCGHLPEHRERRAARTERIRNLGMGSEVETQLQNQFSEKYIADNPAIMDWYRHHYLLNDPNRYADVLDDLGRMDFCESLRELRCPTLIVGGDSDRSVVAGHHPLDSPVRLRQAIPDSNIAILPGSRHYPQIDNPDLFNRIVISYLESVLSA